MTIQGKCLYNDAAYSSHSQSLEGPRSEHTVSLAVLQNIGFNLTSTRLIAQETIIEYSYSSQEILFVTKLWVALSALSNQANTACLLCTSHCHNNSQHYHIYTSWAIQFY
jgi:hypothetical protein